jgi:integrase
MRGSVVKRGKTYSVVLDLGRDPQTGRRRQKWHGGFRTKADAERAVVRYVGSVNDGLYIEKTRQSLEGFAREWLGAIEPTVRPATHYSYERNLRLHVVPYVGLAPLAAIDAGALNGLYGRLLTDGRKDYAGGGLSPRSVRYVHTILHRIFKDAVRWGRLARNPADAADPPRGEPASRPGTATWSPEELRAFLDGVRADRLYGAYLLLATTGMRRGEALGLRWQDLDLDNGRASIRQTVIAVRHRVTYGTPKTAKGRRTVVLDASTIAALREHRRRQAEERLQAGAAWVDHGLIFCRPDGGPLHPERFTRRFSERLHQLGLPAIRLHDLRHGWATMALSAGVHPKIVQERLGHANIGITLDIYSHVTATLHGEAAEKVANLVFRGS